MSASSLDSAGNPVEFWFNIRTGEVESGKLVASQYRIGPFQTEEEARLALQTIASRSKAWREADAEED